MRKETKGEKISPKNQCVIVPSHRQHGGPQTRNLHMQGTEIAL
jgi:hypothetical protein